METNQRRQEEKLQCHNSFLPRRIKEKGGVEKKEQEKKWKKYTEMKLRKTTPSMITVCWNWRTEVNNTHKTCGEKKRNVVIPQTMPKAIFHYGDHLCPIQSLKTFGFLKQFSNTAHHLNIFHSTGKIPNSGWSHPIRLATLLYDEMAPRQQCSQQCPRELRLDIIRYSMRIHIWLLCKWLSPSCDYFITLVLLDYCNRHTNTIRDGQGLSLHSVGLVHRQSSSWAYLHSFEEEQGQLLKPDTITLMHAI